MGKEESLGKDPKRRGPQRSAKGWNKKDDLSRGQYAFSRNNENGSKTVRRGFETKKTILD